MLNVFKRYGVTALGGLAIAGFVAYGVLTISSNTVADLVASNLRTRGEEFAKLLLSPRGNVDAFLTGVSRDPDAETTVRKIADLADIDSFKIFDRSGAAVYGTRSDTYGWLLRDRPGGISSGDRLAAAVLERTGDWQIVEDVSTNNPKVINPLVRNGETIGYVMISSDTIAAKSAFASTLATASLSILIVLLIATGVPLLIYLRRKQKIAEADDHIRFLANHDPLTRLLNRRRMVEETDKALITSRATRERMAYLFIDVDDMAEANDRFGQAVGDELLKVVSSRLSSIAVKGDLVARIGPDDFAVLHRHVATDDDMVTLSRRIAQAIAEPIELAGELVAPRVSIGCAMMPKDGRTHSELVKHAEIAHLHHKADKSREIVFFDPAMDDVLQRRREVEALLRTAIAENAFELHYQPIVDGTDHRLLGFEALVRMRDANGDYIPPSVFVPIAETRGYIKAIGGWVLREATRQVAEWPEELFVSVNLSIVQFNDGDLVDLVKDAMREAGIEGRRLEVEIVESLLMERSDPVIEQLRQLKALGISIDMDDFGTGYSSLGYLWRFPFDKLKIDQSFMIALANGEPNVPQILETIVAMAHQMKMKVTAEGVETEEQVALMRRLGCNQLQGYHFGRPMPADKVAAELLKRFNGRLPGPTSDGHATVPNEAGVLDAEAGMISA